MGTRRLSKVEESEVTDEMELVEVDADLELMLNDPEEDIEAFTDDEEILEDFLERQALFNDTNELSELLSEHNSESPILTGGDVDAAWDQTNMVGEEAVGGSVQTPDKDVVDELGAAVGLTYDDEEPLHTWEKLHERDEDRWELNPASADDQEDEDDDELV
jgi:hypothetical protein